MAFASVKYSLLTLFSEGFSKNHNLTNKITKNQFLVAFTQIETDSTLCKALSALGKRVLQVKKTKCASVILASNSKASLAAEPMEWTTGMVDIVYMEQ
ncbi:hypothetical protein [Endozoicomonas arenosclerae]|uniref:hypothetical protein n=1 Tax=Endozoicomonas arenosclerae TaxID=1633495 RepID=UPI000784705D|nr:hypothetical protein [Endozoicomonas arenosclerae]